jgi:hypothetical protein
MQHTKLLALGGALLTLALTFAAPVPSGASAAGGTTVTVRVEGLTRELLATKTVTPHSGWITKGGTPTGKCPATSAAGALDVATHHRWGATYSSSLGEPEIISILGEKHSFSSKYYWSVWTDNHFAQVGSCELKLHRGEQLLFAAVPDTGPTPYPIALSAPSHASKGVAFKVKVVWFPATGASKPLTGAEVDGVKTGSQGIATITDRRVGTLVLRATKPGYIRAAPVRVTVT